MAHVRQSGPDSGHDFQVKVLTTFQVVPSWLDSRHLTMYGVAWTGVMVQDKVQ